MTWQASSGSASHSVSVSHELEATPLGGDASIVKQTTKGAACSLTLNSLLPGTKYQVRLAAFQRLCYLQYSQDVSSGYWILLHHSLHHASALPQETLKYAGFRSRLVQRRNKQDDRLTKQSMPLKHGMQ